MAADWLKQMVMRRLQLTDRTIGAAVGELTRKHNVPVFGVKMKRDEVWDDMYARPGSTRSPARMMRPAPRCCWTDWKAICGIPWRAPMAWARGDIAALRKDQALYDTLKGPKVCTEYFEDINVGTVQQRALRRFSYSESVRYLKNYRSTLVVVPISILFERNGLITRLKRAGYKVEEPASLSNPAPEE